MDGALSVMLLRARVSAPTVLNMSFLDEFRPLDTLHLGDIVAVPDGRSLTVRALVELPEGRSPLGTFAILGEMEMLLAQSRSRGVAQAYAPVDYMPPALSTAKLLVEGVAAYWAPHLVAHAGAMGEISYRVFALRSQVAPLILVYRGPDLVVFVPAGEVSTGSLRVTVMPRPDHEPEVVSRYAAVVDPIGVPMPMPSPVPAQPAVQPVRLPTLPSTTR